MENQTIERTILSNLINNEEFARKVLPFIKADYFDVKEERIIFDEIQSFVDKYNKPSTQTALEIEVSNRKDLNEVEHQKIVEIIKTLKKGSRIMVTGYNKSGSQTIDHYSLLGFTKAYNSAKKNCS